MRDDRRRQLADLLAGRVAILDGAGGTMLRPVAPVRSALPTIDWLNLERPDLVGDLHRAYLAAGADIVKTNTFNATAIVQAGRGCDSDLAQKVNALNRQGARLARAAADAAEAADPAWPRFVAGVICPTQRSVSRGSDPARGVAVGTLEAAYRSAARSLIEGGADMLLIETVVDSANAAIAIRAARSVGAAMGVATPLMVSATVTEDGVHTLDGQTMTEFWRAFADADLLSIGLNCAFGAAALCQAMSALAAAADIAVTVHPNAGLPDTAGFYGDGPEAMAAHLGAFVEEGIVNIVGGCCGTTPAHIAAIAAAARDGKPRSVRARLPM